MKTILVMTDFSVRAEHAAHYALKLAQKVKANLLLCNVFLGTVHEPATATPISSYPDDYRTYEEGAIAEMAELAARLNRQLNVDVAEGAFRPAIRYCCKGGPMIDAINDIALTNHVLMAVIGTHHEGGLTSVLLGNHTSQVIDGANCPVLVVPYQTFFKDIKKMAFATDLGQTGVEVLHCLAGLAKHFDAEILITHVAEENGTDYDNQHLVKHFFNRVAAKTNYPEVYYQAIKSNSVTNGLDWLTEHTDVDMLVLIHHKRNFIQKIFERSVTQKMAANLLKPMLVFPSMEILEALPVF
ncbi:universal stress protein [uncultured Mucilaginibacter sp.]|uniref:universal stress protein n=1 Tax=uncultured Mucilaginibacter sp. TaxID=797541 RepID=UPI0025DD41C0|nr:universal stress protein [uncultured Mucilaginibacter sp.]